VTFVGIGIFLAYQVYARHRLRVIEPNAALHGWHVDEAVSWVVGNPGLESWQGVADFDHNVVDGTVMGAGALTKSVGSGLRRYQSGLIRLYALGIGLGAVLLLGWFLLAGIL
jgi:NADH-quinone oxidoreductase subunit L